MTKLITTKKIGVLMGGESAERDVSVRSGLAVYQALQELGYNAVLIDVGKDIVNVLKKDKVRFAFLALHGGTGENGAIQGMLDVLRIPYTGSGVLASALAMDKIASKKIFSYHGLPVPPFVTISKKGKGKNSADLTLPPVGFSLPWVLKPAAEGSSIGVHIVKQEGMLNEMLGKAFSHGKKVIIERFIEGKEVHIGMLGKRVLGGVEVRPSLEFYNYEAKYTSGLTEYILPPEIHDELYERASDVALQAHDALGCSGVSRVDLIIDREGTPYVLEVNTLPGMTTTSLIPKIAQHAGLSFQNLIEEIIRLAVKEA
jgi:D-alanine-D-alanine ligase